MPLHAHSPTSVRTLLRRFRRSRRGSAALQFALVAPLFFALLFAIIEVSLMFFAGQYLETVNQNLARLIMTGQAQQGTYTSPADFLNKNLCQTSSAPFLFTCSNLLLNVQCYPQWSSVSITGPLDSNGNLNTMHYNPGGQGSTVVVQLSYPWPTFVTGLGFNLATYGNKVMLTSTAAFKTEPYGGGSC